MSRWESVCPISLHLARSKARFNREIVSRGVLCSILGRINGVKWANKMN